MDIDSFIDELEKVCECPNQGYIKCLEKVKELKAENEKHDEVLEELKDGISDLECELEQEIKERCEISEKYDKQKMDIKELHLENEKLKEKVKELKEDNSRLYKAWDSVSDMVGKDIVSMKKEKDRHYINYMNSKMDIKKLKAENEKLKDKFEAIEQSTESSAYLELEIERLKEDNKMMRQGLWIGADSRKTTLGKLEKEIEKLKQFAMKVHNFAYNTKYDDEDIVSSFDFDAILEEMKKDEDKLKEEIEDNKLSISCLEAERDYVDPKGKFNYIDDYADFNRHLKKIYNDDMYKKMYEWFDMDNMLDEDEK